jgi:hypothetical protein
MRPPAMLASLLLGGAALMPRAAAAEPADAPAWVIDPARPGDSLPPAGGSLFDALFAEPAPAAACIACLSPSRRSSPASTPSWPAGRCVGC